MEKTGEQHHDYNYFGLRRLLPDRRQSIQVSIWQSVLAAMLCEQESGVFAWCILHCPWTMHHAVAYISLCGHSRFGLCRAKIFPGLIPPSHLKGEYPGGETSQVTVPKALMCLVCTRVHSLVLVNPGTSVVLVFSACLTTQCRDTLHMPIESVAYSSIMTRVHDTT